MKKCLIKAIQMFSVLMLVINITASGQSTSPFNHLAVKDTINEYAFIVSGHFHGASTNYSTFPASTILANLDTLNSQHALFLMSLGDLFLDVNDTYLQHYHKSLFQKLAMPFFNVVGNHDIANGNMYEKVYGKTWFSFKCGSELYIGLNTEVNDGNIKEEQLDFFKNTLKQVGTGEIKNVFIFSHRPVWAESIEKYKKLFTDNTRTAFGKNNFSKTIEPLLKTSSTHAAIFWISGSLGSGPASFFYDRDEQANITYMQTAIRNVPRDAVLKVDLKKGKVSFSGISLTGEKLNAISSYNVDYWLKTISPDQQFNFRLLPYLVITMVKHHFFWIGVLFSLIIFSVICLVRKKWKKRE